MEIFSCLLNSPFLNSPFLSYSNRKLTELYTEDLKRLTSATLKEIRKTVKEKALLEWIPLVEMKKIEPESKCLKIFEQKSLTGFRVSRVLKGLLENNRPPFHAGDYEPSTNQPIENLEKLMNNLKTSNDQQTFALKSESASDVYWIKRMALPKEFKFLTEGHQEVRPDTKGSSILIYELYLPFNNALHTDKDCVSVEKLPLFYKSKGKDSDD